eukprot:8756826-Heterocapsa_arctica.AAC.1
MSAPTTLGVAHARAIGVSDCMTMAFMFSQYSASCGATTAGTTLYSCNSGTSILPFLIVQSISCGPESHSFLRG